MNRIRSASLLGSALFWACSPWLCAELDPVRYPWLAQQAQVLHWDNVEGAPGWLDGVVPRYSREHDLHLVELQPGAVARMRLPAGEQVRVLRPDAELGPEDVEITWSNGTGLHVTAPVRASDDGHSLFAEGSAWTEGVVRIVRPPDSKEPIRVALFNSRRPAAVEPVSYTEQLALPAGVPRVRPADGKRRYSYWRLNAGEPAEVIVHGATRVQLETRFVFPAGGDVPRQGYRVYVLLDDKPWRTLEFETVLQTSDAVAVDGCIRPLGFPESGYLDVPEGDHRLELRADTPLYLRLLARQTPDEYLWNGNRPRHDDPLRDDADQHRSLGSVWSLDPSEVAAAVETAGAPDPSRQRSIMRLLQDNGRRGGGLLGSELLRAWALSYPNDGEARVLAERARGLHTFYRDLLPSERKTPAIQQFAWFQTPRIRTPGDRTVVPQAYAQALASQLAGGHFLEVPVGAEAPHEFLLPDREAPSQLRISVDRTSVTLPARIYVQYDSEPPWKLTAFGETDLPRTALRPGRAEAALAVLDHNHGARGLTLAGPSAQRRTAAPLLQVGLLELPLPQDTRRVRIWRDEQAGAPLRMAVQYRASNYYRASETGYLALLETLGPGRVYEAFRQALATGPGPFAATQASSSASLNLATPEQQDSAHDLHNQWLPLLRLLSSRRDRFIATVHVPSHTQGPGEALTESHIDALRQTAERAGQAGDWLAALEAWSAVWRGATGATRDQAALARADALEHLGESYLAEQQLRVHFLGSSDDRLREQALARLLARYERAGDGEARLTLLATAALRAPDPTQLRALAEALLALGQTRFALQVALALPAAERPRKLLLQASYEEGWWTLFDTTLSGIADPRQRRWWEGLRAQASGDYAAALSDWSEAGGWAAAEREQLQRGLAIRAQLTAPEPAVRQRAILGWENWQADHPGPHRWENAPQLIRRYAGGETLHVLEQDLSLSAFRATAQQPVTLQVYGPVRLRISTRPLHPAGAAAALNDWVSLRDAAHQRVFPISENRPSPGLQLVGPEQLQPGRAVAFDYQVTAGLHEIEIAPEQGPVLVQVATWRPTLPLAILPTLSPDTVRAALEGRLGVADTRASRRTAATAIEFVPQCGKLMTIAGDELANPVPAVATTDEHAHTRLRELAMLREAQRDMPHGLADQKPDPPEPPAAYRAGSAAQPAPGGILVAALESEYYQVRPDDTLSSIALQYGQDFRQIATTNGIGPPYTIRVGQRLRVEPAAIPQPTPRPDSTLDAWAIERMQQILWVAEHDASQLPAMLASAEELFQHYPDVPGLQPMLGRLRRAASWELVPAVQQSAGVRVVTVSGWQPEHPATRARKALLPPLSDGEQLVSGFETLVLAVAQPTASQFQLGLTVEELAAVPPQPVTVVVQLDDQPERTVLLTPQTPRQTLPWTIPGGKHVLRVTIEKPVLGQFLRVAVKEGDGVHSSAFIAPPAKRSYHIATREEPVVAYLEGPTRLRIDELREGRTGYRYTNLGPGWHPVTLEVRPGQEEALFRIHRQTLAEERLQVPPRAERGEMATVPAPAGRLSAAASQTGVPSDWFSPGGQEDGTWTLATALVSRRNLDEDRSEVSDAERFAEFGVTHRYFASHYRTYFRTDLLTRLREDGGPTLGARGWIDVRRREWPVDVALRASLYAQQPDQDTDMEWATSLRGEASRRVELTPRTAHRPEVSVFQRWQSLDDAPQEHPERVDQDLFTQYKKDHPRGLGLGDTLSYHPWLDTLWFTSLELVSNRDLNPFDPDHAGIKLGARQLIGDWQVGAEYLGRRYFADADRDEALSRHRLQVALDWLGWQSARSGWHGRVKVDWDSASGHFSGLMSLAWNWANGRFYRDFRPGETGFLQLRRRRLQEQLFATPHGGSRG